MSIKVVTHEPNKKCEDISPFHMGKKRNTLKFFRSMYTPHPFYTNKSPKGMDQEEQTYLDSTHITLTLKTSKYVHKETSSHFIQNRTQGWPFVK